MCYDWIKAWVVVVYSQVMMITVSSTIFQSMQPFLLNSGICQLEIRLPHPFDLLRILVDVCLCGCEKAQEQPGMMISGMIGLLASALITHDSEQSWENLSIIILLLIRRVFQSVLDQDAAKKLTDLKEHERFDSVKHIFMMRWLQRSCGKSFEYIRVFTGSCGTFGGRDWFTASKRSSTWDQGDLHSS